MNFCNREFALNMLVRVRLRQTAPPYLLATMQLWHGDFITLPLLILVCDTGWEPSSDPDPRRFISVAVRGLIFLYIPFGYTCPFDTSATCLRVTGGRSAAIFVAAARMCHITYFHMYNFVVNSHHANSQYKRWRHPAKHIFVCSPPYACSWVIKRWRYRLIHFHSLTTNYGNFGACGHYWCHYCCIAWLCISICVWILSIRFLAANWSRWCSSWIVKAWSIRFCLHDFSFDSWTCDTPCIHAWLK